MRTWTFIANRSGWLRDAEHWQGVARQVEDTLSDALHARLAQRFVDRRASVLMRRLRENAMLEAEVTTSGDVMVEGQHVGQLNGFRFTADPHAVGEAAKALNAAAQKALASEIEGRAARVHEAVDEGFVLANDGVIRWLGEPIAKIAAGAHVLQPTVRILADDQLTGPALDSVQRRLDLWLAQHVKKLLGPLADLEQGEGLEGIARGIAFQVAESLGVLERAKVAEDVKTLPQEARGALRKFGIRFGAYHLYLPNLVKPAPRALAAQLWALKNGGVEEVKGVDDVPHLAASGRTSFVADKDVPKGFYRAAGFRVCGERAVRVDILERLADLIRPAIAYRPGVTPGDPPSGAADGDGFVVTVAMTSSPAAPAIISPPSCARRLRVASAQGTRDRRALASGREHRGAGPAGSRNRTSAWPRHSGQRRSHPDPHRRATASRTNGRDFRARAGGHCAAVLLSARGGECGRERARGQCSRAGRTGRIRGASFCRAGGSRDCDHRNLAAFPAAAFAKTRGKGTKEESL